MNNEIITTDKILNLLSEFAIFLSSETAEHRNKVFDRLALIVKETVDSPEISEISK